MIPLKPQQDTGEYHTASDETSIEMILAFRDDDIFINDLIITEN